MVSVAVVTQLLLIPCLSKDVSVAFDFDEVDHGDLRKQELPLARRRRQLASILFHRIDSNSDIAPNGGGAVRRTLDELNRKSFAVVEVFA